MNKKTDKRLLSSIDYIDDKFTERAAKRIKERPVGVSGGISKKRMVKYVALLAACMILLGAAIPVATNLLKNIPGNVIEPSASNPENTSAVETKPEEYFDDCWSMQVDNTFAYNGCFIYTVEEDPGYYRVVKYDPVTNEVSSACLSESCSHTYADCALASPIGWSFTINAFGDWIIYETSATENSGISSASKTCLYNMKTGEFRIISEMTTSDNIIKYSDAYVVFEEKVYLYFIERDISDPQNIVRKHYIERYDPETDVFVYMCEEPEGMGFIGVSNKRFFYTKSFKETWSSDHKGENVKQEEVLTFEPIIVSGTYAYNFSPFDDDDNPATKTVFDLATDSTFSINFGGTLKWFTLLEDKILYTIYKNEDKTGGIELWACDLRGENKQLLFESEELLFNPTNCIGNYIFGYTIENTNKTHYLFNTETGEIKAVERPALSN